MKRAGNHSFLMFWGRSALAGLSVVGRAPVLLESVREMSNTIQRLRNSSRGKNWDRWYENFKTFDTYYHEDPTHVRWFPKEIRQEGKVLEARLYQRLFDSNPEEINFQRACAAVDTIRLDHGVDPQSWMYAGVLLQLGETTDLYFMSYFWKQLRQNRAVKLEANAFNAMVRALAKNVDVEGAQYVIEEMRGEGIEVNANTYNQLCTFDRPSLYYVEAIMEKIGRASCRERVLMPV